MKYFCDVCEKSLSSNIKRHLLTNIHIKNSAHQSIKSEDQITENTKLFRSNSKLQVEKIISDNNIEQKDYKRIFECLTEKYKLTTSLNYFKSGYLMTYEKLFNKREYKYINVFLNDIVDKINNEKIINDDQTIDKSMTSIDTNSLKPMDKNIIDLYKVMPLRISEFINIRVFSEKPEILHNENNYIILDDNKILINRSKTKQYDEFLLTNEIMEKVKTIKNIDNNLNLYDHSVRTFQNLLNSINTTTQEIRKIYAQEYEDKIYAARVLGHKLETHLTCYRKIK